ncbi:MAG: hypothetical protein L3J18_02065 [Candidatus Brocadia sp.]|nr:MAG: hypothetical protein L3J18_02065 [Candidatus Brocadia sp.]
MDSLYPESLHFRHILPFYPKKFNDFHEHFSPASPYFTGLWGGVPFKHELGIEEALGKDFQGRLALWQVMSRVINQGSRLSAVRLAHVPAAGDVLGMKRGFDENDLYDNLLWLSEHQAKIERTLFDARRAGKKPKLFLYDVTSSYMERRVP